MEQLIAQLLDALADLRDKFSGAMDTINSADNVKEEVALAEARLAQLRAELVDKTTGLTKAQHDNRLTFDQEIKKKQLELQELTSKISVAQGELNDLSKKTRERRYLYDNLGEGIERMRKHLK